MFVLLAIFTPCLATANCRAAALLRFGATLLIAVALPASPALSQETPAHPVHSVVTVIDRTDIEMSGLTNVADLLGSRWTFNNFGLYRSRISESALPELRKGKQFSSTGATFRA